MIVAFVMVEAIVLLSLLVIAFAVVQKRARNGRIATTPLRPVAGARTGLVALKGTVVASEHGTGSSFAGKPIVVWNARIFDELVAEYVDEQRASVEEMRPFWLDDGSGDRAWIEPDGCTLRSQATQHGPLAGIKAGRGEVVPNVVVEMTPSVLEWTHQHYQPDGSSHITVDETAIGPGDEVYILGRAEREPGGLLRLAHGSEKEAELVVSTLTATQLQTSLRIDSLGLILVAMLLIVVPPIVFAFIW